MAADTIGRGYDRVVSVVVSFVSVLDSSQPFGHGAVERHGRGDAPGERPSDDLLSGLRAQPSRGFKSRHLRPDQAKAPGPYRCESADRPAVSVPVSFRFLIASGSPMTRRPARDVDGPLSAFTLTRAGQRPAEPPHGTVQSCS